MPVLKLIFTVLIILLYLPLNLLAEEQKTYQLLLSLPLTGNAAYYGQEAEKAAKLAIANLPVKNLDLVITDDQLNTLKAVSNYKSYPEAIGVISFSSGTANGIAPLAEKDRKLHLAIASDQQIIQGRKFSFLHWVTPEEEVRALREEIVARNYQRISIVNTEHTGSNQLLKTIKEDFAKHSLTAKIILEETFLPEVTDFKNFIMKAKKVNSDAVIMLIFPGALANFTKQASQLNWSGDFVGIEFFEDENEIKAANGTLLNQWYVNTDLPADNFAKKFQETYQTYPSAYTANVYDSIHLISKAITETNANREEMANFLLNLKNYQGACGTYSSTNDGRFDLKATVKLVTEDGFKKIR